MRYFEKISFQQFKKDISEDKELYDSIILPSRNTKSSAGYDIYSLFDMTIKPNEIRKIPLAIKVNMNHDEMLMLCVRSSMGFKYNVRFCNQVGIIDSDYYNNPDNEGHIYVCLQNHGDKDYVIKKNDKICQGIFMKYLTVDNEREVERVRTSGLGSTDLL
jgi:dUTP pyrophosphatase